VLVDTKNRDPWHSVFLCWCNLELLDFVERPDPLRTTTIDLKVSRLIMIAHTHWCCGAGKIENSLATTQSLQRCASFVKSDKEYSLARGVGRFLAFDL